MGRLVHINSPYAGDLRATLILPRGYKRDGTRTLIVAGGGLFTGYYSVSNSSKFAPGSPGIDAAWTLNGQTGLLHYLADHPDGGYPILCVDALSGASLGQTDCLTSITNAIAWARLTAATTPYPGPLNVDTAGIGLIGYSRFGLIAANWVARNLADTKFLMTFSGALDPDDTYDNNRGGIAKYLDASYYALTGMNPKGDWSNTVVYAVGDTVISGGLPYRCTVAHSNSAPPSANWTAITTGASGAWKTNGSAASPSFNPTLLPGATLAAFPPTFLWKSTGDTVIPAAVATTIAAAIGANAVVEEVPTSPAHGAITNHLVPADILEQIRTAAPL